MKKIFAGITALTIAFSASAQKGNKHGGKHGQKHHKEYKTGGEKKMKGAHLDKQLNLSESQTSKLRSINEDFRNDMQELKANTGLTKEQQQERRAELIKEHRQQIQSVLTDEQKQELKNKRKEFKEKDKFGKKGNGIGLKQRLDLTEAQQQKMQQANVEFRTKVQEVRKDQSLTSEKRKEQVAALQKKHNENIKSILTDEQRQKLEEMKKNRAGRTK